MTTVSTGYYSVNSAIYYRDRTGESTFSAVAPPNNIAKAVDLLNRAARANDKCHYTQSARLMAQAEALRGFAWAGNDKEPSLFAAYSPASIVDRTNGYSGGNQDSR